jgi:signal transduction histidine kinase
MQQLQRTYGRTGERLKLRLDACLLIISLLAVPVSAAAAEQTLHSDETLTVASVARPLRADLNPETSSAGNGARAWQAGEQYLPYILLGATALFLQGFLINLLLRERGQRRRCEAEARESTAQLAHLNKIATAGELSASMAHELTQPITGMVASANAALRWLSAPTPQIDQARSALRRVVSAGDRTSEIIHGVRAMFKREAEERSPLDINTMITSVMALVDSDLRAQEIAVETALEEPPVLIAGDHAQLQQVVMNLIVNAMASMSAVTTRARVLRVRAAYTRDRVWISIADVGTGIRRDDMNQIFKPLFTTKPKGMGMGLSICRSIVEAHKGRIWVSPGEPHGAVFHFVLPSS